MSKIPFVFLLILLCFKFAYAQNNVDTAVLKTKSIIKSHQDSESPPIFARTPDR